MERKDAVERSSGAGRRVRTRALLGAALALASLAAAAASASPAMAGIKQEFEVFKYCPVNNPVVVSCAYSTTTSGEFHMGSKTVPVTKTVILQGGLQSSSEELVPATNGETLSKTQLQVPGGLVGIELLGTLTEVNATAELAGPVDVSVPNFGHREGSAVTMPLKVRLENPLLGNACYIGSESEPIGLHLTTGTTSPPQGVAPMTGSEGTLEFRGAGKINVFRDNSLVDNTFPVPGVNGCAGLLSLVVDPSVDLDSGLPSPAGKNDAVLSGTLEQASTSNVRAVDALPEIGRCTKTTPEKVGHTAVYHGLYQNSGCTYESPQRTGQYEWATGAGSGNHFTESGLGLTLETVGKKKVTCTASSASGEYTGTKGATIALKLTGCTNTAKEACQSSGAAAGEVLAGGLVAELGFIKDVSTPEGTVASLGWDLKHEPTFLAAECGSAKEALSVTGSVIGKISAVDKMAPGYTVAFTQSHGVQAPESFEEEPNDTLATVLGGEGPEKTGLKTAFKVVNQEKLEFKALAE